jgi:hypothetical protein
MPDVSTRLRNERDPMDDIGAAVRRAARGE